jgi:hypothetical protein
VKLLAVAIGPEEIRIALKSRNDVFVVDERNHPLLLRPHAGAIWVGSLAAAIIKQLYPCRRSPGFESLHVVTDLEQVAARRAAIDNFEQAELAGTAVDALKPCVIVHRSETFTLQLKQQS